MALGAVGSAKRGEMPGILAGLVAGEGTASHRFLIGRPFTTGAEASRNLADAMHTLCMLHGRRPGVIDLAAERGGQARRWLDSAADAFAQERAYLTRIVVAAGPLPSTPGQAESETAVIGQRHALEMLARSDRNGCAMGAALALVLDWHAVRAALDAAAHRFGVPFTPSELPDADSCWAAARDAAETPAVERAMVFGAQQILVQHRGLWDLLEARMLARRDH